MLTATATEASSKEPRKPHCEPPIFSVLRSAPGPGSPDLAAEARQRSPSGTLTVSAATSDPLQGRPPRRGGRLAACRLDQAVHVRPSPARSGPCGKQLAVAGFDDDATGRRATSSRRLHGAPHPGGGWGPVSPGRDRAADSHVSTLDLANGRLLRRPQVVDCLAATAPAVGIAHCFCWL